MQQFVRVQAKVFPAQNSSIHAARIVVHADNRDGVCAGAPTLFNVKEGEKTSEASWETMPTNQHHIEVCKLGTLVACRHAPSLTVSLHSYNHFSDFH